MNQVERLKDDLSRRFPGHTMNIDVPADGQRGSWFLDIHRGDGLDPVVIEWRPDRGFGISTPGPDDYGTGVDEIYPNTKAAYDRVIALVLSGGRTEPPTAVRLAELRRLRGLTQGEVAGRAGIKQAAVARIEGREDILLSTLDRIVSAMGATLSIRARFPDGTERELRGLTGPAEANGPAGAASAG